MCGNDGRQTGGSLSVYRLIEDLYFELSMHVNVLEREKMATRWLDRAELHGLERAGFRRNSAIITDAAVE